MVSSPSSQWPHTQSLFTPRCTQRNTVRVIDWLYVKARTCIYIVEKLERKLLWISRFVAIHQHFLHKVSGRDIFWLHQQAICKSFLYKNLFSTNSRKLSPAKVSRYTILTILLLKMSKIFRETSCTVYAKYQCVKWPPARAVCNEGNTTGLVPRFLLFNLCASWRIEAWEWSYNSTVKMRYEQHSYASPR